MITKPPKQQSFLLISAVALALGISLLGTGPAGADPTPLTGTGSLRIAGSDRYSTAVEISKRSFDEHNLFAIVASGETYPDALAAGAEAAHLSASLLLVRRDSVPPAVLAELKRLHPTKIFIVGGTGAVSSTTASNLSRLAPEGAERIWGHDRYETAAALEPVITARAFVASGEGFADAMAAGPVAGRMGGPVLLTPHDRLAPPTETVLKRMEPPDHPGGHTQVFIVGGTAAISGAVESRIKAVVRTGVEVIRVAGRDRYDTARRLAGLWSGDWGTPRNAYLASGVTFPDAVAAASSATLNEAPILLTNNRCTPQATSDALNSLKPSLVVYLGGPTVTYQGSRVC